MAIAAVQMLLDGSVEEQDVERLTGMTFADFIHVSRKEGGLLSPSQAAVHLGVSKVRVHQLMEAGILRKWVYLGKPYVSCQDVADRREADVKTGRPKRGVVDRIKGAAKVIAANDMVQVASCILE